MITRAIWKILVSSEVDDSPIKTEFADVTKTEHRRHGTKKGLDVRGLNEVVQFPDGLLERPRDSIYLRFPSTILSGGISAQLSTEIRIRLGSGGRRCAKGARRKSCRPNRNLWKRTVVQAISVAGRDRKSVV